MKVPHLQSISEILPEHRYQTGGSRPVRVFCSDMNDYVCKYSTGGGFQAKLFNEYIAACFLRLWNLPVPEIAFVDVKTQHLQQTGYPPVYFSAPCFGSKFNGYLKEIDNFFIADTLLKKIDLQEIISFLKIGLFDIWLCNEDRHQGNYILLFDIQTDCFVPIDHVCCFNSCNIHKNPELISDREYILSSPIMFQIFSRTLQQKRREIRLIVVEQFKTFLSSCYEEINNILNNTPLAWNPDKEFIRQRLLYFFSENWINQCLTHFNYMFEKYTNK